MKRIIPFFLIIFFATGVFAQGTITVTVTSSEAVTGITEISYELPPPGAYDITVSVRFSDSESYVPILVAELTGLLEAVPFGVNTLTWTPGADFQDIYSTEARIKVDAVTSTFTDDRDGNTYRVVRIGDQVWMAENLRYLSSVVGPSTGSETTQYFYVQGYDGTDIAAAKATDNYQHYGVLYNWPAARNGAGSSASNPSGVQGACPPGWHVPSDAEWDQLVNYVVSQGYPNESANPNGAGNALKSCRQVDSTSGGDCNTPDHPRWDSDGTHNGFDAFGFSALPGGDRNPGESFSGIGSLGYWWSSTEGSSLFAWARTLGHYLGSVFHYNSYKSYGFSLRCVRDLD
jgi:uncharacterized protein (TIGR02145 family)